MSTMYSSITGVGGKIHGKPISLDNIIAKRLLRNRGRQGIAFSIWVQSDALEVDAYCVVRCYRINRRVSQSWKDRRLRTKTVKKLKAATRRTSYCECPDPLGFPLCELCERLRK